MCGIIGIVTKKGKKSTSGFDSLFHGMMENAHRGCNDGFGFVDVKNKNIFKSLLTFREIKKDKVYKRKIDSFTNKEKKKFYKGLRKDHESIKDYKEKVAEFVILHHRKASVGEVAKENVHPIKMNDDVYYVHNGTIYDFQMLKAFLKWEEKIKFDTDLDSEVLAKLAERKIEKNGFDGVKEYIEYMSEYYFGILIRIDLKNQTIHIIKDNNKQLYVYEGNDFFFLSSEPLRFLKEGFKKCFFLVEGTFKISPDGLEVMGEKSIMKNYSEDLQELLNNNPIFKNIKCDYCEDVKFSMVMENTKHKCLDCFLHKVKLKNEKKTYQNVFIQQQQTQATIGDLLNHDFKGPLNVGMGTEIEEYENQYTE